MEVGSSGIECPESNKILRMFFGAFNKLDFLQPKIAVGGPFVTPNIPSKSRHRGNGVGRGGGRAVFNQILTRFHGIRPNSV